MKERLSCDELAQLLVPRVQRIETYSKSVPIAALSQELDNIQLYGDDINTDYCLCELDEKRYFAYGLQSNKELTIRLNDENVAVVSEAAGKDAYVIKISESGVIAAGADKRGLYYALLTLKNIIKVSLDGKIPCLEIQDWPDFDIRGIQFFHCLNQWSPIGVDPHLMPRWKEYSVEFENFANSNDAPAGLFDLGRDYMRFDEDLALDLLKKMSELKMNQVMLLVGDSIKWRSRPEIALADAWEPEHFCEFIDKIKALHIDVMPALNFSPLHDSWLGEYGNIVDSQLYNEVVEDLIRELASYIPDAKYMHLGMDEEDEGHLSSRGITPNILRPAAAQLRQLEWMSDVVKDCGMTAAVYGDIFEDHITRELGGRVFTSDEQLLAKLRSQVLVTDWRTYAGSNMNIENIAGFMELGFEQIPTSYMRTMNAGKPIGVAEKLIKRFGKNTTGIKGMIETVWAPFLADVMLYPENMVSNEFLSSTVLMSAVSFWNRNNIANIDFGITNKGVIENG